MTNESENSKRLAKNTLILYARMLFTVGISFYTTRLILVNLGVENYGIYNVIGGFVAMFYMVTSTMTQAVGRFLTFELGTGDVGKLRQTFATSVNILLLFSLLVILLGETVGLWFVNAKLNIEATRMDAANWIYQFTLFSFVLEMISVPYGASVISHEKMGTFAFVTIAKVFLTLGIALLLAVSPIDRLIFYGLAVFLVSFIIQLIYWIYCRRNFPECKYLFHIDRRIFEEMFGFAGWNFLSTTATMLASQGVNILLNMHFGTSVNAARGVASQINGTSSSFARNFTTALSPQITKTYAAGDLDYAKRLVCNGSKFSFLLLYIIALPCIIEIDFILSVWLKEVPAYSNIFVQLILMNSLVEVLTNSSETLNNASGKIRHYQILMCIVQSSIFIGSYVVLSFTDNVVLAIAVSNIILLIAFIFRILSNKPFIGITFAYYFENVLKGVFIVVFISSLVSIIPLFVLNEGWTRLFVVGFVSTISIALSAYHFVLLRGEREKIIGAVKKRFL